MKTTTTEIPQPDGRNNYLRLDVTPPLNKWKWALTPEFEIAFHVASRPNWFHRLTQRLLLGIFWKRTSL